MSILAKKYFRDEASAFHHLEGLLWPDGPICSHCGTIGKAGRLEGVRSKPSKKNPEGIVRHGLWKCYSKECRKQFTVLVGTVFEAAHIPLHKMLQAAYLLTSSKKGISAHQLLVRQNVRRESPVCRLIHDPDFGGGFEKASRIPCKSLDEACKIFERYNDDDGECRQREHVVFFWITRADSNKKILGTPPKNWSPDNRD
jgi:hypothetical protein